MKDEHKPTRTLFVVVVLLFLVLIVGMAVVGEVFGTGGNVGVR
jgi:hypothetical protein